MVERFDHEDLSATKTVFVADKDLHGRNVLQLAVLATRSAQSTSRERS